MRHEDLREYVIRPVLEDMKMHTEAAENILVMIAAHESHMGTYLKQTKGPACGIYQIEPRTEQDVWDTYLTKHGSRHLDKVERYKARTSSKLNLCANLPYQTALARIILWRISEPLPAANDLEGLARYAKKHWNTEGGAATWEDYLQAYLRFGV